MTVNATATRAIYQGNGTTGPFPIPFRFMGGADVLAVLANSQGEETPLVAGTHYVVSGVDQPSGGELTTTFPVPIGSRLAIIPNAAIEQKTKYVPNDPFPARSHERALDRLTLIAQRIYEQLQRAITVPITDGPLGTLPAAAKRALKIVTFDENGALTTADRAVFGKGDPGGNVMSVAAFTQMRAGDIRVPLGARRVRTAAFDTGYAPLVATGGADYVRDDVVTPAYAAANPLTSFRAPDENGVVRGYRLDEAVVTPQMLGGKADGVTSLHTILLALSGTKLRMNVPPGDYLFDNTDTRQINYFTGELKFEPGARLIFNELTRPGLFFYGGSPTVRGVRLTTLTEPTERLHDSALLRFDFTTDAIASDIVVERGSGAGVLVRGGTGFGGDNINIKNTLADGFDFFNHSEGRLSGLRTFNTGDDGLGCVSYYYAGSEPTDLAPQGYGLTLSDIQVRQSNTRGISFIGYANCTLTNWLVEETQGDGVIIERDDSVITHLPTGISIANGSIKRAGQRVVDPNYTGNKFGVKIGQSGSVRVVDVEIVDAKSVGFNATSSNALADLYMDGIRVQNAGDEGIYIYNHRRVTFGTISVKDSRATGFRTLAVDSLIGGKATVIRGAKGGGGRAVWHENNAYQSPGHTHIEDLQAVMTGNVYRVVGAGRGSVGTSSFNTSGAFYREFDAIYMDVPKSEQCKRDDGTPGNGDAILSQFDALDRRINAPLTTDVNVIAPQWGMYHGQEVTVTRFDGSGTFTVNLKDPNNGNNIVTSIPPGSAMRVAIRWDDSAKRWRAHGKITL